MKNGLKADTLISEPFRAGLRLGLRCIVNRGNLNSERIGPALPVQKNRFTLGSKFRMLTLLTIGTALYSNTMAAKIIDDRDPSIIYTSGFKPDSGEHYNTTGMRANAPGQSLEYTFTGTNITWFCFSDTTTGKVDIYLDGKLDTAIDTYVKTTYLVGRVTHYGRPRNPIYTRVFPSKNHTIKIVTRDANKIVSDAFVIDFDAVPGRVKAFCIDFNWSNKQIAEPGQYGNSVPQQHVDWYINQGCNTIQTFAVSTNGYAFYKNGTVPEQPGMKSDFLPEVVRLGHSKGLKVMGYFCMAVNPRWQAENPSYGYTNNGSPRYRIPFTKKYREFIQQSITEAIKLSDMDGFLIDWLWNPVRIGTIGTLKDTLPWLDCEKELYQQLMGKPFPGERQITNEQLLAYERTTIDSMWAAIRYAAKKAKPSIILWLSCNKTNDPTIINSKTFKETDWLMNEAANPNALPVLWSQTKPEVKIIQCMAGWGTLDARNMIFNSDIYKNVSYYGYAAPNTNLNLVSGGTYGEAIYLLKRLYSMDTIYTPSGTSVRGDFSRFQSNRNFLTPSGNDIISVYSINGRTISFKADSRSEFGPSSAPAGMYILKSPSQGNTAIKVMETNNKTLMAKPFQIK